MKKEMLPVVLCSILFFSCEKDNLQQGIDTNAELSTELEQLVASYEESLDGTNDFTLKGYQVFGEKDEITPTQEAETTASEEIINYLKAKVDLAKVTGYSKTARAEYPQPVPNIYSVGVFKTTTCGNNPEFIYFMDCEDGGYTNIENPTNQPFATKVDKNKNIEFHMCVVTGANLGGFGLGLSPIPNEVLFNPNVYFVERLHDNEDHDNKNNVLSDIKPDANGHIGISAFTANTLFAWVRDNRGSRTSLPYKYGVIDSNGTISLNIDDENGKNANFARSYELTHDSWNNATRTWVDCPKMQDIGDYYCYLAQTSLPLQTQE